MNKYAIWDKISPIITPSGEVFTAEEWMERYPVAKIDTVTIICSAGEINGGFFGTLGQLVTHYESQGCDFSACTTPEEKLAAIEAFEVERKAAEAEASEAAATNAERQTAALEAIASGQTAESTAAMNALFTGEEE